MNKIKIWSEWVDSENGEAFVLYLSRDENKENYYYCAFEKKCMENVWDMKETINVALMELFMKTYPEFSDRLEGLEKYHSRR